MNWTSIRPWLGSVIRLVLGGVWIWASIEKLSDPRTFLLAVRAYQATPEWLSKAIAYGLPVLEFSLGLLLIVGLLTRITAWVSAALFVVFLIGITQAWVRGLKLDCGCFGGGGTTDNPTYLLDILRDMALVAAAVYLILWPMTRWSLDEYFRRHDYVEPPSAKRMRTTEGKRKYEAMVATHQKQARERTRYQLVGVGVIVVLVIFIGIGVQSGRTKIAGDLTATNATVAQGVQYGQPKAPVVVDIYEDFQCPVCNEFEQSLGTTMADYINSGKVLARYHVMAFLDSSSQGNRYSSRAANAAICASDISPQQFYLMHEVLYGKDGSGNNNQPSENTTGRTDSQLIGFGTSAGITGSAAQTFSTCVTSEQHKAFVAALTDRASRDGVNSTPTVKVNGKELSTVDKASLVAAVDGGLKSATPAPALTPTPVVTASPAVTATPAG